jgi:predicted transcriptional regulator of viral defense system
MKKPKRNNKGRTDWDALVEELRQRTIISHAELVHFVRQYTRVTPAYALVRLQRDGVLHKIEEGRRGVYLVMEKDADAFAKDPVEAIQVIYGPDAPLVYGTALFLHGLSRYGRLSVYYVIGPAGQRPKTFGDFVVKLLKSPLSDNMGIVTQKYGIRTVCLTNLERTLIDCIHRPKYAQGWENVAHALRRAKHVNGSRIIEYVKLYRNPSLVARVGFVLEHFGKRWRVVDEELDSLREFLPRTRVGFDRSYRGKLHKRWNLIAPEGVFEEEF